MAMEPLGYLPVSSSGVTGYGAAGAHRTHGPPLIRRWLYQLSYDGTKKSAEPLFDALDDSSITQFFGSKRSSFDQTKIFCHLHYKIPVPAQGGFFRHVNRI